MSERRVANWLPWGPPALLLLVVGCGGKVRMEDSTPSAVVDLFDQFDDLVCQWYETCGAGPCAAVERGACLDLDDADACLEEEWSCDGTSVIPPRACATFYCVGP